MVWRALHPPLLRFLWSLGRDDAEDVATVVWIEMAQALPGIDGDDESSVRRMLFTIARRRMIDEIRRRNGPRAHDLVGDDAWAEALPDRDITANPAVRLADGLDMLRQLPAGQAEVIALRVIAGFSAAEVGELTGQTAGAVRVMAHRGLERLREVLAENQGRTAHSGLTAVTDHWPASINET